MLPISDLSTSGTHASWPFLPQFLLRVKRIMGEEPASTSMFLELIFTSAQQEAHSN